MPSKSTNNTKLWAEWIERTTCGQQSNRWRAPRPPRARDDGLRPFLIPSVAFFLSPWQLFTSRRSPFSLRPQQAFRAEVPYRSLLAIGNQRRRIETNFREFLDQIRRPPVNIEFPDPLPHAPHPRLFFFGIHFQAETNGLSQLLHVVRVHHQGVAQLTARSGKTAEDENAFLVLARGNEFLGHQVHAVVERSHQAQIGGPIILFDLAGACGDA